MMPVESVLDRNSRGPRIERMQPETLIRSLHLRISRSLALLSNGAAGSVANLR
jgi:hypothetical protein